jgi:nucleotide-binding universal stress UspA family protein
LAIAERMCRLSGSAVTILHIIPPNRTEAAARLDAAGTVDRTFTDPRSRASVQLRIVPHEVPLDLMLQSAPEFDLVIVGVDETWGLESHWFGFRPQRLADESATSVLIVRRGTSETDPRT